MHGFLGCKIAKYSVGRGGGGKAGAVCTFDAAAARE